MLPARLKLVEFAEFARDNGLVGTTTEAMCLLAGHPNATTAIAEQLWESRSEAGTVAIAQEGDGYGLSCAHWLEDSSVPTLLHCLYRPLDASARPAALLSKARKRAERLSGIAEWALRDKPREIHSKFHRLWTEAMTAAQVTEEHAPLWQNAGFVQPPMAEWAAFILTRPGRLHGLGRLANHGKSGHLDRVHRGRRS